VRVSFETYEATMGEVCRAVRFGDRFLSPRVVRLIAALGARYDLTIEPGARAKRSLHGALGTGRLPSYTGVPREPYRAGTRDPFRAADPALPGDDAGVWMIPLTAANPDEVLPRWRWIARRVRHPLGPRHGPAPLTAQWNP